MRHLAWIFLASMILAGRVPLAALTYEVGGCRSGSGYKNFSSISAAVGAVPPGSTILVCAGVYPEEVTITQPLTLKGVASGNAGRAVITADAAGNFAANVTSISGESFYAQVLVENVTPVGAVNLVGITVDGNGINFNCPTSGGPHLAGIFYASGTSGTVKAVTARNQLNVSPNGGCGYGIWAENGGGASQTINIAKSSVHETGAAGISANSPAVTLTADISQNFVTNTGIGGSEGGIDNFAAGAIDGNVVTIDNSTTAITGAGPVNVLRNTVADASWAFNIFGSGNMVESNSVSNVQVGMAIEGGTPTVTSNTIMHTTGCALTFTGHSTTGTVSGNKINDSPVAFANWFGPAITGNVLFNVNNIQATTSNCP